MVNGMELKRKWCYYLVLCFGIASHFILHGQCSSKNDFPNRRMPNSGNPGTTSPPVRLAITKETVVMDNGIVQLTLKNPTGSLNRIQYEGIDNLLESNYQEGRRGYWDIVWSRSGQGSSNLFDTLEGTTFKVIGQDNEKVEISFSKTFNPSTEPAGLPLNFDKRFILLRGSSGFYSYAILEQLAGWPELHMEEARIAFKLEPKLFNYMAISDDKQRIMPSHYDFESGKTLQYKEAKLLTDPDNKSLKGQVEDKYQYSMDNKDNFVHGWVSSQQHIGFWVITPSDEFRSGGPIKTDLTSHSGPTALSIFFSGHYAGPEMGIDTQKGEPWKKVFGPIFFYLNSNSHSNHSRTLWNDAKRQMVEETKKWPYDFPLSPDLPRAGQRGTVTGRLMVNDRYTNNSNVPAKSAYIGLAPIGEVGSWQIDSKGYQFWAKTNGDGSFSIQNIRPGTYNVYAWVPGVIGDFKYNPMVDIKQGSNTKLGDLVYNPPRNGPTIWEIGIPDRTAAEFFIPDPSPGLRNSLYTNHKEKYRQYGLWDRYTDLYPHGDLVYTIGQSNYQKDWFFAHVNRRVGNKYVPTTWQIKFSLANVRGSHTLRIALASATYAQLQVRINDPDKIKPLFKTGQAVGRDNAIARHGIHGLYWLYQVNIPATHLVNGINTIYLTQSTGGSPFNGVMYDYIRLEGPPQ